MTRNEFLNEIYRESGFMLPEDRRKAINYFREKLAGTDHEETECAGLGEPGDALKRYLSGDTYSDGNIRKYLKYAALLFASPVIIYTSAAAIIILLIIVIAALILLSALPLIGVELWLSGIDSFVRLMPTAVSFADGLCMAGTGFLLSGIGIFIMLGVYKLYKKLIPWLFGELISSYGQIRKMLRRRAK